MPSRAISYARVSTAEQAESGLSVASQQAQTDAAIRARGWHFVRAVADEGVSGTTPPQQRSGLRHALEMLAAAQADALVVSRLDRLGRDTADLLEILTCSVREGWALVALDAPLDPASAFGECCITIMAAIAQLERRLIGERTKAALAVSKSQGTRLGRPCRQPQAARALCVQAREAGHSLPRIARMLTEHGYRTATGKTTWHPSTVASILRSEKLDREADQARRDSAAA
ncbi:recombinase family protein [Candidatus Poriferisodalis sp.]|uniref:recombinase family protein n=1 Tax=Candidatus Poriferisodalis sp. TaxID=3101277 RepID=UPI003B530275